MSIKFTLLLFVSILYLSHPLSAGEAWVEIKSKDLELAHIKVASTTGSVQKYSKNEAFYRCKFTTTEDQA